MKAWAIYGPNNLLQWCTNHSEEEGCIECFVAAAQEDDYANTWESLEQQGYTCRQIEIKEVE